MKKVLIITYYWIPSGGSGVQRWIKFVKYLRNFGWEPIVYAPENPEYPSEDLSFVSDIPEDVEVIKTPIWEPYDIYRNLTGNKGKKINTGFISENKKSGWKDKLSIWIRGNFLIPDPRKFWVKPSVRFLSDYIGKNPVDAIITTGPPHSMHLIGFQLKKRFQNIPWIADFRDPWTKIYFFKDLMLSKCAYARHQNLERKFLKNADQVIVVANDMKRDFENFTPKPPVVITNGFDEDDVKVTENLDLNPKFSISHIGLLTPYQNPSFLWKVLTDLVQENPSFKEDLQLNLIGKIDFSIIDEIKNWGLEKNLVVKDYIPHQEAIRKQQESQLLLLLLTKNSDVAKGLLTGKFFEYLASGRPIIGIGPEDSEVAEILNETGSGKIVNFGDEESMKRTILDFYEQYKSGKLVVSAKSIEKYSRRELTKQLSDLLNNI